MQAASILLGVLLASYTLPSVVPAVMLEVHWQNSFESEGCDLALCIQKPTGPVTPACHHYHPSRGWAEEFYPPYILGKSWFDLVFILCGP